YIFVLHMVKLVDTIQPKSEINQALTLNFESNKST
ncbi:MAG: hypothetical protein RI940_491, partial [Bacteroidota bacterium]